MVDHVSGVSTTLKHFAQNHGSVGDTEKGAHVHCGVVGSIGSGAQSHLAFGSFIARHHTRPANNRTPHPEISACINRPRIPGVSTIFTVARVPPVVIVVWNC